ncbi:SHOCT domain-containing protein [Nocardioides guangzhouensis]|uniref:SHOCT domain-containing protein n=1 Tax=Nocardioides guangzhouensis TaxID=2497878 RepID=A0A4Q4ZEA0_9ACTN|nr:SHOCT domain-containing protein [Nocardioides guangzhouensis]RYP85706.1 SHOCT domain-containing protein [Nocardioides guangzhouensis]
MDGPGFGGGFAALFVLVLLVGIGSAVWRATTARRIARRAGLDERDAATMAVATDDGLEATYLAASLRARPPQPVEPRPTASSADRLRELQRLLDEDLVTQEEYDERRRAIIDGI